MKKYGVGIFLLIVSAVLLFFFVSNRTQSTFSSSRVPAGTLIIDPGHGGEDGGAVSVSGVSESGINLSIGKKVNELASLYGIKTVLLREADVSLADADAQTIRQKKRTDLVNRTTIVNETSGSVLLSIHQNNYSKQSSSGAQVFYRSDELSQQWAVCTQQLLRENLDLDNERCATQIPESVYLMNHVEHPAILVECGFLSNQEEDKLLQSDTYQTKLATVLVDSYLNFYIGEQIE